MSWYIQQGEYNETDNDVANTDADDDVADANVDNNAC